MERSSWSVLQTRDKLLQKISLLYTSDKWPWFLIGLGILLRLVQYLLNRSLNGDESSLALNLMERPLGRLLEPLAYNQAAPVGFLVGERLAVKALGPGEYVLRLFPLVAGILSLFLFYRVARHCLKPRAVPIALGLFAISGSLIYYSSNVKQYSSDVMIGLAIYLLVIHLKSRAFTLAQSVLLGGVGALALWFSHASIFILAGIGISMALFCLSHQEYRRLGLLSISYVLWAVSLGACYVVSLRDLGQHNYMLNFWKGSFMPLPPGSLADVQWFVETFFAMFVKPIGLPEYGAGVAGVLFLIGCMAMWQRDREWFYLLIAPGLVALLASGFDKYPFSGRLLLFLTPYLILLIAEGIERLSTETRYAYVVMLIIFLPLLYQTGHDLLKPPGSDMKSIVKYVQSHQMKDDIIYSHIASITPFKYYSNKYGLNNRYIEGDHSPSENYGKYVEDLLKLRGNKRVWLVFSYDTWLDHEKLFLYYLDQMGPRLDAFETPEAWVYLYDLSGQKRNRNSAVTSASPGPSRLQAR